MAVNDALKKNQSSYVSCLRMIESGKLLCITVAELDLKSCSIKIDNISSGHVYISREIKFVLTFLVYPYDKSDFLFMACEYAIRVYSLPSSLLVSIS